MSLPHTRSFPHSLSESQSPWPRLQGAEEVQKLQSQVEPVPLQAGAGVVVVVGAGEQQSAAAWAEAW